MNALPISQARSGEGFASMLNKVREMALMFWITKILSTKVVKSARAISPFALGWAQP